MTDQTIEPLPVDAKDRKRLLRFLLPSLAGILIFLIPVNVDGNSTIVLGVLTNMIRDLFNSVQLSVIVGVICLSAFGGIYHTVFKPDWELRFPALYAACHVPPLWLTLRVVSAIVGLMLVFDIGPGILRASDAGPFIYTEAGAAVLYILFVAMFLMPLLTDFGFMDFVGTLLQRPFKFLFLLPGNAAVDATASFVSASTVAMMVTLRQYERNIYTAREAVSIAANFSIVSIPYCLFIASFTGFGHMFFTWYLTVVAVCLITAVVTVRLPPLSWIEPEYLNPEAGPGTVSATTEQSLMGRALKAGMDRAATADSAGAIIKTAWVKAVGLVANVLGPSMLIGTMTILVIRNTDFFLILSYPIALILGWLNVPEAAAAAPGFLVGFLDMFMPAAVASGIESEFTRFILAGVAVSQIIYMSDLGVIILRSKLPVRLSHLVGIFLLRTFLLLPLFYLAALLVL